jgi:hypothetical protein
MLDLTRVRIVAFRRRAGALDQRLPSGPDSLRQAAWAGLQDSMPRAALLSIHARVEGTEPSTWEDRSLVQLWGPRHNVYMVPARDLALFSIASTPTTIGGGGGSRTAPRASTPAAAVFDALVRELTPVRTPIGEAWILAADEPGFRGTPGPAAPAGSCRAATCSCSSRVPTVGSWSRTPPAARRSGRRASGQAASSSMARSWGRGAARAQPWRSRRGSRRPPAGREAIESEAAGLPLPGVPGPIRVRWEGWP